MSRHSAEEIRAALVEELAAIAPEANGAELDPRCDFRKALEIDSFDFLRILTGLNRRLGVEFPEADYGQLVTFAGLVAYIEQAERAGTK